MQVHIKIENLELAINELSFYDCFYKVEVGVVYGKPCYWILFAESPDQIEAIRSISKFEQDAEG